MYCLVIAIKTCVLTLGVFVAMLRLLVVVFLVRGILGDEEAVVETPLGFLRGAVWRNVLNGTFYAFLGVPFAKPPLGPLRFMPPQPVDSWEGVRDAVDEAPMCSQIDLFLFETIGVEDCLNLDVFTPKRPRELKRNPLPVIVLFHGGLFHFGSYSRENTGPDYLMTQDVVVVFVRYRLGVYGFLSFQDELLPGNAGLKDQVLALKWVRNNIASFGGDRDRVTLAGFSAGAASAHFHMISPLSRGLFHRVIAASGSALAPWALSRHPLKNAEILADVYNCSRKSNRDRLRCLQNIPADELTVEQYNAILLERLAVDFDVFLFGPCVESETKQAFLPADPYQLLSKGKFADVPFLTGTTRDELSMITSLLSIDIVPENLRRFFVAEVFRHPGKLILKSQPFVGNDRMGRAAVQFYFRHQRPSLENLDAVAKFFTDYYFLVPAHDSVTLHLRHKKSAVYQYSFNYNNEESFSRLAFPFAPPTGVAHGDLFYGYVMHNSANSILPDHDGFKTMQRAVKIWSNFAAHGDPTPDNSLHMQWIPSEFESRHYLDFGVRLFMRQFLEYTRISFWITSRKDSNFTV